MVIFEITSEDLSTLVEDNNEKTDLERLIIEEQELGEKIISLSKALNTDYFSEKVGFFQFELLGVQHSTMLAYRRILIMRISDLKAKQA